MLYILYYILYNFHLFLGDWTLAIPYTRPLYSLSRSLVGAPLVVPELFGLACGFCIIRHQLRPSTVGKIRTGEKRKSKIGKINQIKYAKHCFPWLQQGAASAPPERVFLATWRWLA